MPQTFDLYDLNGQRLATGYSVTVAAHTVLTHDESEYYIERIEDHSFLYRNGRYTYIYSNNPDAEEAKRELFDRVLKVSDQWGVVVNEQR